MSFMPSVIDDLAAFRRPRRLMNQHFGLGLTPDDFLTVSNGPLLNREYFRTWRHLAAATKDLGSNIKVDVDKYQINLDVQHFAPEEISVKTAGGYIIVEGNHEEKKDEHGYISRRFVRKYELPEGTLPEAVESKLSSDGVLIITVPKPIPESIKDERKVPIVQTGPVRKEIKDQNEGTSDQKKEE
ncbi:PREDICTED: protein lethal(2)essential for life-like [Papilio xuthus]|uniref:Protein lethal(2)essential for life-like n=1 Tax=Papilio xuthus TaxID=66420 RepID=A0A194Q6N8_PAPXU|nr:PREDICTED: protein lethal(2)essential for life-like [Papilio xuthus]KPJ00670.1 hypothetical protein RR46_07509 [Papilio xuthus]